MDTPEDPVHQCTEWADEYLLEQFALGPTGYAVPASFDAIRAEVARRNLSGTIPPRSDVPPGAYVVRLWHGEIGLGITYWGWFVVAAHVLGVVVRHFARAGLAAVKASSGDLSSFIGIGVFLLLLAYVGYVVFALVAVWRSAGRYRGSPILAALAMIVVVLNGFVLVGLVGALL